MKASDDLARSLGRVPVLILVLMPKIAMTVTDEQGEMDVGPTYASVYPAVQNLVLAASAASARCSTVYRIHEDELRALCDIPDRYEVVALLPLGHPKGRWGVAPRRPAESLTSGTASGSGALLGAEWLGREVVDDLEVGELGRAVEDVGHGRPGSSRCWRCSSCSRAGAPRSRTPRACGCGTGPSGPGTPSTGPALSSPVRRPPAARRASAAPTPALKRVLMS